MVLYEVMHEKQNKLTVCMIVIKYYMTLSQEYFLEYFKVNLYHLHYLILQISSFIFIWELN